VSRMSWDEFVFFASALMFTLSFTARSLGVSEYMGVYVAGLGLSVLRLRRDPTLSYSTKLFNLLEHITTYMRFFVYRFSADGGSLSFVFTDFKTPHHLLLNGLSGPPHRSDSPLVA